jgi:hypothetical protein
LPIITCQATKHMSRLLRERMPRGIQWHGEDNL